MHQEIGKIALGRNDLFRGLPPDPVSSKQNKLGDGPPHQQRGAAGGGGRLARRGCGRADHAVAAWSGHRRIYGRRPLVRRCYLTLHKERHRCLACRDEHPHRLPPLTPMPPTLQRQGAAHYGPARRRFSRRQQLATVPRAAAPTTGSSSPRPRLPLCDNTLLMVNFRQPRVLVIHWFRL
jgi:hypothetical protein